MIVKYNLRKNSHIQFISKIIKIITESTLFFTVNDILKIINNKYNISCFYGLIRNIIKNELKFSYKKIKYTNHINETTLKDKTNIFCRDF